MLFIASGYLTNAAMDWIADYHHTTNPPFRIRVWELPQLRHLVADNLVVAFRHDVSTSTLRRVSDILAIESELTDKRGGVGDPWILDCWGLLGDTCDDSAVPCSWIHPHRDAKPKTRGPREAQRETYLHLQASRHVSTAERIEPAPDRTETAQAGYPHLIGAM